MMLRKILLIMAILCSSSLPSLSQCTSSCQTAFDFVVRHEDKNLSGVISQEPFGGVARFGINSIAHPESVRDGFYKMSKPAALRYASRVFYRSYWKPMHLDAVSNTKLATKLADLAFNLGPVRATVLLQRALNKQGAHLNCKGYFGPETLNEVNDLPAPGTYVLLKMQAYDFYTRLSKRRLRSSKWRNNWLARLNEDQ